MRHVFHGTQGGGFHYEGVGMRAQFGVYVDEETRRSISGKGIYTAAVIIRGSRKKHVSHFFPQCLSRVQVLAAVKEAHASLRRINNGCHWGVGWSESYKMRIAICLGGEGRICTAFPLKGAVRTSACLERRRRVRRYRTALRWWVFVMVLSWMQCNNFEAAFVQIEPLRR
jgi:hypothetical protein